MKTHIFFKSEEYLIQRLICFVKELTQQVREIDVLHEKKVQINNYIIKGIKSNGQKFSSDLDSSKHRLIAVINQQQNMLTAILKTIEKIYQHLQLIIHSEQASLAIHNRKDRDTLSEIMDIQGMTIDKYKGETDRVKMLEEYINILKVELEKQKDYINEFNINDDSLQEEYFFKSEEYEARLSKQEIVKISQLRSFSVDIQNNFLSKTSSKLPFTSEADKVASEMRGELKTLKIPNSGLFPLSMYTFLDKFVKKNVRSRYYDEIITFLLLFLLSRLKRFRKETFYLEMRSSLLMFCFLKNYPMNKEQKYLITAATLLANLNQLHFSDADIQKYEQLEKDELTIITNYYKVSDRLLREEITVLHDIIDEYKMPSEHKDVIFWIKKAGAFMEIVFDFDNELQKNDFNVDATKLMSKIQNKRGLEDFDNIINFLVSNWRMIIPESLRKTRQAIRGLRSPR